VSEGFHPFNIHDDDEEEDDDDDGVILILNDRDVLDKNDEDGDDPKQRRTTRFTTIVGLEADLIHGVMRKALLLVRFS